MDLIRDIKKAKSTVEHIIYEQFGRGNLSKYSELISQKVVVHVPPSWKVILPTTDLRDQKIIKRVDQEYSNAFKFEKVEIEDLIVGENKILCRWYSHGLHKGNLFHLQASNRPFYLTGQSIYQFDKEEQVAEVWQAWDMLGLLQQIQNKPTFSDEPLLAKTKALSRQELICLDHLLQGKTTKETALSMNLSSRTVEYYFENIKNKLECFRKRDLLTYARLLEKNRGY